MGDPPTRVSAKTTIDTPMMRNGRIRSRRMM
jgi:hypothetical protein